MLGAVYRLLMLWKKPSMAAWQDANTMHWDDAVRKPTPLRAALARSILLVSGMRLGLACGQVLWDIEAFFDSFAVADVVRAARDLEYPARLLPIAVQQRASPRLLTSGGALEGIHNVCEGVLLGGA